MSNKKKIAVFLSGLDEEYQNQITQGIHEFAAAHNIDVLHFIAFGGILNNGSYDTGEYNIFRLPNLQELDGVILLTNTIACPETVREIIKQVRACLLSVWMQITRISSPSAWTTTVPWRRSSGILRMNTDCGGSTMFPDQMIIRTALHDWLPTNRFWRNTIFPSRKLAFITAPFSAGMAELP